MSALQPFPEGAVERLAPLLEQAKTKAEYQRIQGVWLRAALGLSAPQIAQALGWQPQSVRQLHSDYRRHGEAVLLGKPKGGRRHQNLTVVLVNSSVLLFTRRGCKPKPRIKYNPDGINNLIEVNT